MSYIIEDHYDAEGNLLHWDDETRQMVTTAPDGTTTTRPYTPDEVAILEQSIQFATAHDNGDTLKEVVRQEIATLRTEIDELNALIALTNAEINSSPASYIKALARLSRSTNRRLIAIAKVVADDLADATLPGV